MEAPSTSTSTSTTVVTHHWQLEKYSRSRTVSSAPPPSDSTQPLAVEWDHYTQPRLALQLQAKYSNYPTASNAVVIPDQLLLQVTYDPLYRSHACPGCSGCSGRSAALARLDRPRQLLRPSTRTRDPQGPTAPQSCLQRRSPRTPIPRPWHPGRRRRVSSRTGQIHLNCREGTLRRRHQGPRPRQTCSRIGHHQHHHRPPDDASRRGGCSWHHHQQQQQEEETQKYRTTSSLVDSARNPAEPESAEPASDSASQESQARCDSHGLGQ